MAWMDSAEVTYVDASTCFSEEEWKLLQEWQKDLYRNVMKEIHQALMSLGPLIATTVFSLRAKENEELHSVNNQYMDQRHVVNPSSSDPITNHEELFMVNSKKRLHSNLSQDSEDGEMHDFSSTDAQCNEEDNILRCHLKNQSRPERSINENKDEKLMESHLCGFHSEGFPFVNAGPCLNKEEPVSIFIGDLGEEIAESLTDPNAGCGIGLYHIKDEDTFCMDHDDRKRIESIINPTDNNSIKKRKKGEESMKGFGKSAQYNAGSGKRNKEQLQSSDKERISISTSQVPELYPELKVEKTIPFCSALNKPVHSNLPQASSGTSGSDIYDICVNRLMNEEFPKGLPNTQQGQKSHDKICSLIGQQNSHIRTHSRTRPYACTACEKSFFEKSHLISHYRTHSGEKPYTCTFCYKSFNRKDNLNGHVRIHTGERPYTCSKCQKNFRRKSDLNLHQKKHAPCKTAKPTTSETGVVESLKN